MDPLGSTTADSLREINNSKLKKDLFPLLKLTFQVPFIESPGQNITYSNEHLRVWYRRLPLGDKSY